MQAIVNTTELVPTANQVNGNESYIIRIEMNDGTFQLVHLSMDQAVELGVQNACIEPKEKPQPLPPSMLNYKIVQPAELNLCSKTESPLSKKVESALPRGRPKKRHVEQTTKIDETPPKPPKIVKTSRTRYGRITKPPTHMEKDYEKIITNVKTNMEQIRELDTVQFEPIKTANNIDDEPPPLVALDVNPKKRNIPAQYKCPSCKKAYLGRNRMAHHFKKYPDHGASSQVMMQDCNTWYYLIETALRANKGKRGEKLCKELVNLIRNVRVMTKNILKPSKVEKTEYVVDAFLAEILNIQEDDGFLETESGKNVKIDSKEFENSMNLLKTTEKFTFELPAAIESKNETLDQFEECRKLDNVEKPVIELHFGSDITDVINLPENNAFANTTASTLIKTNEDKTLHSDLNKTDFMNIFNEGFIDKSTFEPSQSTEMLDNVKNNLFTSNLLLEKDHKNVRTHHESQGKEVDILRKRLPDVLNFDGNDEHLNTLLEKEKKAVTRKSDEFDLNKLHLDEFLPDAPVNSILDTSTGSDDIMNVDQFVNERFKNLTEPEGVLQSLPNTTLALDLPGLECFNFNS